MNLLIIGGAGYIGSHMDNDFAKGDSRIKKVLHSYYSQRGFNCTNETMEFNPIAKNNPAYLRYFACMQAVAEKI